MTKKDYILIANILKAYNQFGNLKVEVSKVQADLIDDFCRELKNTNPLFSEQKFRGFIED